MKQTLSFTLFLALTVSLLGQPASYEVTRYEVPIQIMATGYVGSAPDTDWALPTLACKAMKSMEFEEWKNYWSDAFIEKTKIDHERFQSRKSQASPGDDVTWSILAEVRVNYEGVDYILLYGCAFARSEFPNSEAELDAMVSTDFLRHENGRWINWTFPHDMDYGAPLSKLIDYREVLGFE